MRVRGRPLAVTLVLVALVSSGCVSARAPAVARRTPVSEAVSRLVDARDRSEALRRHLAQVASATQADVARGQPPTAPSLAQLREARREYVKLRTELFELALLHVSAVVEQPAVHEGASADGVARGAVSSAPARDTQSRLARMALSLAAATELIDNFNAVARTLAVAPALYTVWNEADPGAGIPAGSWDASIDAHGSPAYGELIGQALTRLQQERHDLEVARAKGDPIVTALYPHGVAEGLVEAEQSYASLGVDRATEDLARDEAEVRAAVAQSKAFRAGWRAAGAAIREALERDHGLIRGPVHVRVQTIKGEYLAARERLYGLAFKHAAKITREDIPYPPRVRQEGAGIAVLTAVTHYENTYQLREDVVSIPGVRALMNQADPALGIQAGFWDHMERELVRPEYRQVVEQGVAALAETRRPEDPADQGEDFLAYVTRELVAAGVDPGRTAPPASGHQGAALGWVVGQYLRQLDVIEQGLHASSEGQAQFSKTFGNLVGQVELRRGKLADRPAWTDFVTARLRPGDLLLEKTPFRLTDKFIPGHFGHVAMYVGTEAELRALGLWDHPWVARHHDAIRAGRTIVEALREGTTMNSVAHFLNIDDLAILRPKSEAIAQPEVMRAIQLAFGHVGKQYDFRFDNNTWDSIVCSELAFQTYVDVHWSVGRALASYTIAPDDVAIFAGSDGSRPFELVTFVHDGRVVHDRATGQMGEGQYVEVLGREVLEPQIDSWRRPRSDAGWRRLP
jgi:hypothetical protein